MARQQDPLGESAVEAGLAESDPAASDPAASDPAEGFGGEITSVTPDGATSSRWDRHAVDEDALVAQPVDDARTNGDVAGL
jgi:hypothetical protein